MPGVSQTLHCVIRSVSFALFVPVESRPLLFTDTFTGSTFAAEGGTGGGGNVISVLEVATNICGLDSESVCPSGRRIGFIYIQLINVIQINVVYVK